jgi:hypothetical protein
MRFILPNGVAREIPDAWWREAGMEGFVAASEHYAVKSTVHAGWSPTVVAVSHIEPIARDGKQFDFFGMDRARMVEILRGIASGVPIPAIYLKRATGVYPFELYDGFHRYHASIAAGFSKIPAMTPEP